MPQDCLKKIRENITVRAILLSSLNQTYEAYKSNISAQYTVYIHLLHREKKY